jgi:hypothetical protein
LIDRLLESYADRLLDGLLRRLDERAAVRGTLGVAGISSRGAEESPCDNPEFMDRTNTETDGELSWSEKEANCLLDLMGPRRKRTEPRARRSTTSE